MEVGRNPFGTTAATDRHPDRGIAAKSELSRSRLEEIVARAQESRRLKAESDALVNGSSLGAPSYELPHMTMPELLVEMASRIDEEVKQWTNSEQQADDASGVRSVRLPDLAALTATAADMREQASEISAAGTKVDPLMTLAIQEFLYHDEPFRP